MTLHPKQFFVGHVHGGPLLLDRMLCTVAMSHAIREPPTV